VAEPTLEPYATQLEWRTPDGTDYLWGRILAELLEEWANRADRGGEALIEHIKGLTTYRDGGYLRVNVVSASEPADVEGAAAPKCNAMTFALNVLVYGLSCARMASLVVQTASRWRSAGAAL